MEKLNIIGSPIREPQNNKPRIFANVTGELSKKTLPSLAPRDYKGYAIKRVIGELYKGKDPSSLLTYIPRITYRPNKKPQGVSPEKSEDRRAYSHLENKTSGVKDGG